MSRWLKSLKPYKGMLLGIVLLLIIEAFCDLKLPDLTSKIIDTGIQNSGVEHVLPEKITKSEYESAKIFMNDEEKQAWEDAYTNSTNDIYEINYTDKKTLDTLDSKLSMALILDDQFSGLDEESLNKMLAEQWSRVTPAQMGITSYPADVRPIFAAMLQSGQMTQDDLAEMKDTMKDKMEAMGGSTIRKSMGLAFAKKQDEAAGIDLNKKQQSYLWKEGGLMILLAGILATAMILVSFMASKIGASVGRDLRDSVYDNVMRFSNAEIEKFSTASLITRTTNDIQQIQQTTAIGLRMALYSPIIAIGGIIRVISTGVGMGWVIALAVIAILGIMMALMAIAMPKFKSMQKLVDNLNRISREILTGLPVIRAFGSEKREEKRFEKANRDLYKVQVFVNKTMAFMLPIFMFIMFGLSTLIIWLSANRINAGTMQVGQMTAFITYAMQIVMSFLFLTILAIIVPRSAVAAKRIDEVLLTEPSIKNADNAVVVKDPRGEVEFKNVSFAYPGSDEEVLHNISFTAKAGKITAVIGATGSGKSTLIQLIPRLYEVSDGSVEFDGINVKELEISFLRQAIGYVPQKGILFTGDISSNIAYGKSDASQEEIEKAADIAQASEFISKKDEGYNTPIAEGGTNVSGGQKQRLSIARAIAKDPKLLIFDDSFSALDLKTDGKLRKALEEKLGNVTKIVVAQRVSTILHADQILVMDKGSIVGKGTHEELLKNCKTYREIAESQMTKEELYGEEV